MGSRTENTPCPRHLSHCTWLLIIFCYLLQSHLLVEGTLLCFSKFVKNRLFTILFKQFPGTTCTRKVNCVLTCLHEQGQIFAEKIKKLLVFSFLNEQKLYPIPTNKTMLKNYLLPPFFSLDVEVFFTEHIWLNKRATTVSDFGK